MRSVASALSLLYILQENRAATDPPWIGTRRTADLFFNSRRRRHVHRQSRSFDPLTGPPRARFMAWNSSPGDNSYTVELIGEETLFVNAGASTPSPVPVGAAGQTLAWQDQFATLNATPCKPATGVWPNCTAPTASDGFTYCENIGNGSDYGDCAFEYTDGKYNPYTVQSGFLRTAPPTIRTITIPMATIASGIAACYARAFVDGSSNLPAISYGYFEFTILAPNAAAATGATGGTWPAVWQTTRKNMAATGSIELDEAELYGQHSRP